MNTRPLSASNRLIRTLEIGLLLPVIPLHAAASTHSVARADERTFAVGSDAFLLDGKPFQIRCGEMHFARIPREYWRDRLQRAKALGLNAVCAYLFWNYHEQQPGKFDWSGRADAAEFCRLAQQEGLWVILRPGPYSCAEWDMGGLPSWLLKDSDIKLRTRDPRFMAAAQRYLEEVGRVLAPLQVTNGGPIILVQVENEYGFCGEDVEYLDQLSGMLTKSGFTVPLFVCNPTDIVGKPAPAHLLKVVNFGREAERGLKALRAVQPTGPLMCGEFYPGWFDTWGDRHHLGNTPEYLNDLEYMLSHGASFSIYMAHGGTTFGLWSGANLPPYKPQTSSYDYDAPIGENGAVGDKYVRTRALLAKYLQPGESLPPIPAHPPVQTVPTFTLGQRLDLFEHLPNSRIYAEPPKMEELDQFQGAVLYRTTLSSGPASELRVAGVHDIGLVYLDGKQVGVLDRRSEKLSATLPPRAQPARLDVLVYALGRVNFGPDIDDRKGLHAPVSIIAGDAPASPLRNWQVFSFPLENPPTSGAWKNVSRAVPGPGFWRGSFEVSEKTDTFLDVRTWGMGVIWINGKCLGRFWNIGPTQTMYVPGPWLQPGRNEVVVLDLTGPTEPVLSGIDRPMLGLLRPELDIAPQPIALK